MSVKTVPLSCNHCGAPLRVPETARFVTCAHCHAKLAIHHEGEAFFTEVLGEIAARTASIEEHLEEIRMEKDLERVDAAWEQEKQELLVGESGPPSRAGTWFFSLMLMVVGTYFTWQMTGGRRGMTPWLLVIPLTVPWIVGWLLVIRVKQYEESEGFYRRIRQTILRRGRPKRYAFTGESLKASQPE